MSFVVCRLSLVIGQLCRDHTHHLNPTPRWQFCLSGIMLVDAYL
ncbi:hypothetical protein [uncultured Nostoc sp.]